MIIGVGIMVISATAIAAAVNGLAAGALAYGICMYQNSGPTGPGTIPPYQPPDGGPTLGQPVEVCDKTGLVTPGGGNEQPARQGGQVKAANGGGSADDVSEEIDVYADPVAACVVWHLEFR